MNIENAVVFGFQPALRGMRNPMDSWDKSDSTFRGSFGGEAIYTHASYYGVIDIPEAVSMGEEDLRLACKLIRQGSEHRKFLRQIMLWVDFTIPRYVWTELDTYKVSTVRNSCSTMNKLGARALEQSDFESPVPHTALENINNLGAVLREAKKGEGGSVRDARRQLKNDLPEGFLQKATYSMNYENVLGILAQRASHRLPEWRLDEEESICAFLMSLPYIPAFYGALMWRRKQIDLISQHIDKTDRAYLTQLAEKNGTGSARDVADEAVEIFQVLKGMVRKLK